MGGIQSLSRSTYSKLLPETEDHTSFFSFYDVLEKLGIVIGTFGFGFIEGMFSIRESVLMLIVFFYPLPQRSMVSQLKFLKMKLLLP